MHARSFADVEILKDIVTRLAMVVLVTITALVLFANAVSIILRTPMETGDNEDN